MKKIILFTLMICSSILGISQEGNTVLNRPLKNINYMSVNSRLGYGIGKPTLATQNGWDVRTSVVTFFGLGYNFVMKNNWGVDVQINQEIGNFTFGNAGPEFKSGYSTTGVEIGAKKIIFKKRDDTFFVRGGFGYNFLNIANDNGTNDYYYYTTSANGSSMYVIPEVGYQIRFASGNHIIDFAAGYKYSLSDVATTDMVFTDKGNMNEANTATMSGSFIGINVRYSFLFKGFEKKGETKRKVQDQF